MSKTSTASSSVSSTIYFNHNQNIQLPPEHVETIAAIIRSRSPGCRLLVFGLGYDSALWGALNGDGTTCFVESNVEYIELQRRNDPKAWVIKEPYAAFRVRNSLPIDEKRVATSPMPEELKDTKWDVILIDGPRGNRPSDPGRALPIYWSSLLADETTHVFVDDARRELESVYSERFLKPLFRNAVPIGYPDAGRNLLWFQGRNPAFAPVRYKTSSGAVSELNYAFRHPALRILMFHEGLHPALELAEKGYLNEDDFVYASLSWHADDAKLRGFGKTKEELDALIGAGWAQTNFKILLNSKDEFERAQAIFGNSALFVNNAAFLDTQFFTVRSAIGKEFKAVLNSKACRFKRHELSQAVEDRLFITYPCNEGDGEDVDIEAFGAREIARQISGANVARQVSRAHTGLILSSEEGACYASLEYLLSGLPVVSTPSLGGRDEYFTPENSIIAEPDAKSVAEAVDALIERLEKGEINREDIRQGAVRKMDEFRETLLASFKPLFHARGLETEYETLAANLFQSNNKLRRSRNFWARSLV